MGCCFKSKHEGACSYLKPCSLGAAFAIVSVLFLLFLSFLGLVCGVGIPVLGILASLYVGFNLTVVGIIIGVCWALVVGFIEGVILAWLYNFFAGCCCAKSESNASNED
jgi:hypothetical protein